MKFHVGLIKVLGFKVIGAIKIPGGDHRGEEEESVDRDNNDLTILKE